MRSPVSYGALRAFVEVGRLGSIKQAAAALQVTPGAISQQMKLLEATLGIRLLERTGRTVALSREGLRLFRRLRGGFQQIEAGLEPFRVSTPGAGRLVVTTPPSFASCWLASRLGNFTARHPMIEVHVDASVQLSDVATGAADVAIRHGSGDYPGLDTRLLFNPRLVVIAHPGLLETSIVSTSDCLRYPLLQDRERSDWLLWLGLDEADAPRAATKGSGYANDALLIEAAASGQGLAVVRDVYAHDAIASGRVVLASPRKIATEARYFVVTKPTRLAAAKTKTFRRWLQDACAASACPSPALTTE